VLGAAIVHVNVPPSIYEAAELHPLVAKAEGAANHSRWMRDHPRDYSDQIRNRLQPGFFIPVTDYIQAMKARAAGCPSRSSSSGGRSRKDASSTSATRTSRSRPGTGWCLRT
jgi:hypothetical protein